MISSKRFLSLVLFLFISVFVFSQEKQLTLRDAVYLNPDVFPKRMNQLQWMDETENFTYVENNQLLKGNATSKDRNVIVSLDDINAGMSDLGVDSIKRFPYVEYTEKNKFRFTYKNKLFLFDVISKNLSVLNEYKDLGANADISIQNNIAYTIDNDLYIAVGNKQIQITNDEDPGIVNGQTVHRNEFGIHKGTFWSPEGNFLAFYRKDETMVTDYPLVNIDTRIAEVERTKYPMAGEISEEVTLGIYSLQTKSVLFLKTGDTKDHYLTNISWDPNEQFIYISVLNRDQNHLQLNKYDVNTGKLVATLFEEKNEKYVEPEHPMYFMKIRPDRFIWFSERDNYMHLYLYNTKGELLKQLTKGEWEINEYLGVDEKEKIVYFSGTIDSPLQNNIYSVEIKSSKITKVSQDHGTHTAMVCQSGNYIIDKYSSTEVASEYKVLNAKGKTVQTLQENDDPLKDYNLGETSIITLKSDNGDDLYARLIKPANFDSTKQYPVFLYVYGGPHSQLVSDSWLAGGGFFLNYMAQQNYVVFTLDNHGTAHRGLEFEQAIFRNIGEVEVADQMKGVEYLKSLKYVDAGRIGVDGWSYGGFMTISMILQYPGVFKAACAGGPVIDWKYYEIMYGERYMDTPQNNPEGYERACLLNRVDKLEDDLLILHGTMDPTVVWQNSLTFIQKCVEAGKQVEYFVYPGHEHNVRGKDRIHMYEKIRLFFDEKLK